MGLVTVSRPSEGIGVVTTLLQVLELRRTGDNWRCPFVTDAGQETTTFVPERTICRGTATDKFRLQPRDKLPVSVPAASQSTNKFQVPSGSKLLNTDKAETEFEFPGGAG